MATNEAARAFGREVRRRRHALGLTRDVVGERSGLTPHYIGGIEGGQRDPSIGSMVKLAAGLGAPLGELLGTPDLDAAALEGARHLTELPAELREPIVGALRAVAGWAEGRRP